MRLVCALSILWGKFYEGNVPLQVRSQATTYKEGNLHSNITMISGH